MSSVYLMHRTKSNNTCSNITCRILLIAMSDNTSYIMSASLEPPSGLYWSSNGGVTSLLNSGYSTTMV